MEKLKKLNWWGFISIAITPLFFFVLIIRSMWGMSEEEASDMLVQTELISETGSEIILVSMLFGMIVMLIVWSLMKLIDKVSKRKTV